MRATRMTSKGGPFQMVERTLAQPRRDEDRVRVNASEVCHRGSINRDGLFPGAPFPIASGPEFAGIVDTVAGCTRVGHGASGAIVGCPSDASIDSRDTRALGALLGTRPMIETMPLERVAETYERLMSGAARFRMVLTIGQ